ncbi:MAG: hypothetical protein LBE74_02555 [Treponema sp.]|nr:hypothetical protein [Treponema sp.]
MKTKSLPSTDVKRKNTLVKKSRLLLGAALVLSAAVFTIGCSDDSSNGSSSSDTKDKGGVGRISDVVLDASTTNGVYINGEVSTVQIIESADGTPNFKLSTELDYTYKFGQSRPTANLKSLAAALKGILFTEDNVNTAVVWAKENVKIKFTDYVILTSSRDWYYKDSTAYCNDGTGSAVDGGTTKLSIALPSNLAGGNPFYLEFTFTVGGESDKIGTDAENKVYTVSGRAMKSSPSVYKAATYTQRKHCENRDGNQVGRDRIGVRRGEQYNQSHSYFNRRRV